MAYDGIPDYLIIPEAINGPIHWDEGGRVHNWRNHVGEHTRAIWNSLSDMQKLAIAADAGERANAEHWE